MTPIAVRTFLWKEIRQHTVLINALQGISDTPRALSSTFMAELLGQPGRDPEADCFVAWSDAGQVGYALVVPELAIGRVVIEGNVLPSHRNRGVGGRLLEAALAKAQTLKGDMVHIITSADDAESHRFLEHKGFSPVRRYWEMRRESDTAPGELETPPGFSIRSFNPGDEPLLTQVQNDAFAGSWGFCPNTVEEITHRTRMVGDSPEGIFFLHRGGEGAAYCWTRIEGDGTERTGIICMTGVVPSFRGLGLGRTVLLAGMGYLHSQGVGTIELTVDERNTPATDTYLTVGFRKVSENVWYEQRLEPP